MPMLRALSLASLLLVTACDSSVKSELLDPELQKRVNTFLDCFPELFARANSVLEIANTWRVGSSQPIPDPAGLTFTVGSDGGGTVVDVQFVVDGTTIAMQIRFYSPTGGQQTLIGLGGLSTLSAVIDEAANQLRDLFGASNPFMVGDYSISGGGIAASNEAITGIIGGATNQNELEELRTTAVSSTISGGLPATDPCTITETAPPNCSLTFNIPGLLTDETPDQQYPIGEITVTLVGPDATLNAVITFDGTNIARIVATDVPGRFDLNLDTLQATYVP